MISEIAIPQRQILLPRFEFPVFLRNLKDDAVSRMFRAPMGQGAFVEPLGGTGAVNPLASVPWVAQWKFNNDGNDSIGSNNLTNNNSATFTTGKLGGATGATQLVAASSQYWSINDNAALSMGDVDFTICAWVYADTLPGTNTDFSIVGKYSAGSREYILYLGDISTTKRFRMLVRDAANAANAVAVANTFGTPSTVTWYCVIGGYDATNDVVFICVNDGAVDTTALVGGGRDGNEALRIGHYNSGTPYWNGRIDNVCIAKSAAGGGGVLTAAQRTAFYQNGNGTETLT